MDGRELGRDCRIGDRVKWRTLGGAEYAGELVEWDNGTAMVRLDDGRIMAVRGE